MTMKPPYTMYAYSLYGDDLFGTRGKGNQGYGQVRNEMTKYLRAIREDAHAVFITVLKEVVSEELRQVSVHDGIRIYFSRTANFAGITCTARSDIA